MKNFQQLKQDMEVDIDGMLVNEKKKTSSILKKFLLLIYQFFCFRSFHNYLFKCNTAKFS